MKAQKNATEIAGTRSAHLRDGAAVANFLCWFDREAPTGKLTEIDAVAALESFRREPGRLKEAVVPDHLGRRPNGAIVHYRVTRATNRAMRRASCSCSIPARSTRTAPPTSRAPSRSGTPSAEMRERFTRVLKGHIAIARAVFPDGTPARSSIPSRASSCGPPASTSITAPVTASGASLGARGTGAHLQARHRRSSAA
jgi:Xaa-Pro aminopeptidase